MYASWFHYPVTRPYPFRWFTWVTLLGGVVLTVIFSLVNIASSGFYLKPIYTDDPNGTVISDTPWFMKVPFNWEHDLDRKCQPKMLSVGDRFFTTTQGLQYEVKSMTRSANNSKGQAPLSSIPYLNNPLRDCFLTRLDVNLRRADAATRKTWWLSWINTDETATASCTIISDSGPVNLTLSVGYTGQSDQIYDYVIEDNYTTHASIWWGTRLLNSYFAGIMATMSQTETEEPDSSYWSLGGITYFRSHTQDDIRAIDFFDLSAWFITSDGYIQNGNVTSLAYLYDNPDHFASSTVLEGLHHARILQSLIAIDLGSCQPPNLLLDEEGLKYAILAPDDANRQPGGVLYSPNMGAPGRYNSLFPPGEWSADKMKLINESYDEFTPLMGELGCKEATIVAQYLCSVPQRKSTGTMLLAILLADLVFLQAAWRLLNLAAEWMLSTTDPFINACQGCMVGQYQQVHMETLTRDLKPETIDKKDLPGDESVVRLIEARD